MTDTVQNTTTTFRNEIQAQYHIYIMTEPIALKAKAAVKYVWRPSEISLLAVLKLCCKLNFSPFLLSFISLYSGICKNFPRGVLCPCIMCKSIMICAIDEFMHNVLASHMNGAVCTTTHRSTKSENFIECNKQNQNLPSLRIVSRADVCGELYMSGDYDQDAVHSMIQYHMHR